MLNPTVYKNNKMERIYFSKPFIEAVMEEVERLEAKRVFLFCSGSLLRNTDTILSLINTLGDGYIGHFDKSQPHTPRDSVIEALNEVKQAGAKKGDVDLLVAIGGGAGVDTAKMVSLCLSNNVKTTQDMDALRDTVDEAGKRHSPKKNPPAVRMIAVATTLSGGEIGSNIGCTDPERNVKEGYGHPLLMPIAVVYDPALAVHTPERLWLASGIKALDHAVESICAKKPEPVCTLMSLTAVRLLAENLPKSKDQPDDLEARHGCQFAAWATRSSRTLTSVTFGASHGFGHALGGGYGIPHGETSCVILPSVLRYNEIANSDIQRLVSNAMGLNTTPAGDVIESFIRSLGLPYRLRDVGIKKSDFADIAEHSFHTGTVKANPRHIDGPDDLIEILENAW